MIQARSMCLQIMAERTAELFAKCFGRPPRWVVAAPGRVNLIGEHTDYNEGFVLPMAVERYTVMAGDKNTRKEVTLHSMTTGDTAVFPLKSGVQRGNPSWSNYVRGVIAGFEARGKKGIGFEAAIDSSVPASGGLSSSAALEVAGATLLEKLYNLPLPPLEKAQLCQKAEHDFAGVPCGIMDQYAAIFARTDEALLLDCRTNTFTPVPLTDPGITVLIVNTNVRRRVGDVEYAQRRRQCETAAKLLGVPALRDATLNDLQSAANHLEPVVFRRARHVITEIERTLTAARAIQAKDWTAVGELMYASHESLRNDYEVSCLELDAVVEIARDMKDKGIIGARMTGAGFGGCAVCLAKTDTVRTVTRLIDQAYEKATGEQAEIFSSRPASGARVISG